MMNKRLDLKQWENIFRNLNEDGEMVEVLWLDGSDEFVLAFDCELFEDGFESERDAMDRLLYIENQLIQNQLI